MDLFYTQAYVGEEHCAVIGTQLLAQSHQHSALHILISLKTPKPIQGVIQGQDFSEQALIIQSQCLHQFKLQSPYWLILLNRMSTLGICLNALLQQQEKSYLPLSFSEAQLEHFYTACQALENKEQYQNLWDILKQLLPASLCKLEHPPLDDRIERVMQMKPDVFLVEHKINWQFISAKHNLSVSRFSHLFSQETGGTIKQYFLFKQLTLALADIALGHRISDAAMKYGFNSPSHFSSTCRKLMGIKPSDVKNIKFL